MASPRGNHRGQSIGCRRPGRRGLGGGQRWSGLVRGLPLAANWGRLGLSGKYAKTVFVDREGTLWVATEDTVVFLPRGQTVFQETGEHVGRVLQMSQAPDGTLWLAELDDGVRPITVRGRENSQLPLVANEAPF
jgi:hypothetical protein